MTLGSCEALCISPDQLKPGNIPETSGLSWLRGASHFAFDHSFVRRASTIPAPIEFSFESGYETFKESDTLNFLPTHPQ